MTLSPTPGKLLLSLEVENDDVSVNHVTYMLLGFTHLMILLANDNTRGSLGLCLMLLLSRNIGA